MSEFTAILSAEHQASDAILQAANDVIKSKEANKTLMKRSIDKIVNAAINMFSKDPIDLSQLRTNVNSLIAKGDKFNKADGGKHAAKARNVLGGSAALDYQSSGEHTSTVKKKLEKALEYNKQSDASYVTADPLSIWISESNSFVADLLYARLGTNAEGLAKKGAKAVDEYLSNNSESYRDYKETVLNIWDRPGMQATKAWLVPSAIGGRETLHKMSRVFQNANQMHGKYTSTEVMKMDNKMKGMTIEEQATLNDMFSLAPTFLLARNNGLIYDLAEGTKSIDGETTRLENIMGDIDIKDAKDFANLYVDGIATGNHYNIHQKGITEARIDNIEELTALYSLQKIDGSQGMLSTLFNDKHDLFVDLIEKSVALDQTTKDMYNESGDKNKSRGNNTLEYYEEPFQTQVVPKADLANGKFNMSDGWETIIKPEDNFGHAVVIRKGAENAFQESFGTNIDYGVTDEYMPKGFKPTGPTTGLVEFGTGKNKRYKVVVPMKIKKELGLIQNPAQTLVRSYAHNEKIRQTAAIRDEILSNSGLRFKLQSNDIRDTKELEAMAIERGENEPWFIDMASEVDYSKLPDAIKKRYAPIKTHMSGVGKFSSKVRLVRNDIAPWMAGYKRALPFENTPGLREASKVIVQAIALMKIHMIIVNPAKVTLDAISTTTLLMSNGVSPLTIGKGWKRNIKLMTQMSKLKADEADYTIRAQGGNVTAKRMLEKTQEKIKNHPLQGAMNAGVMQSLTTDIITRDSDTISGLQRNIEKIFNGLTHHKSGSKNNIHKAIVWFSKAGLNIEDLMEKIADMGKDSDAFKQITEEIGIMGERIGKIKKDEDVAKYLSEYFASPSSTLTRLGSVATTYPDAMSRIIYRDHLISKSGKAESDMTDKEISDINIKVSDMMPDYSFAPPMELDAAGRFFITPFVSYSARIQRVLLNLAGKNPLTFFGGLLIADLMGLEPGHTPYHVVGSNYITREEFINNVFTDLFDLQTPLPVNALNFDIIK